MIVSFYFELQAVLSATVSHFIRADQTLSLHFLEGWFSVLD